MSSAEPAAVGRGGGGGFDVPRSPLVAADLRLVGSELRLVLTRRRNVAMLAVLALAPVVIGIAVQVTAPSVQPGQGPPFFSLITQNGLFLAFTALVAALPAFLPLVVGVVSGEAVAGEANQGTLRYLLVTPVGRTRLLLVKYVAAVVYGLVAALVVGAFGVLTGAVLFGVGDVALLSGTTVSAANGLGRVLLVCLYVAACLAAVAALGLLVSTLTEVPIAAMAATVVAVLVLEILDSIPQLDVLDPWLFTHHWTAFAGLLRSPVDGHDLGVGLLVQLAWVVVLLSAAWARLTSKDVTS